MPSTAPLPPSFPRPPKSSPFRTSGRSPHGGRSPLIRLRHTVYRLIASGTRSKLGHLIDFFLVGLIVANVVAVILESVEDISLVHGVIFRGFDDISVAIFLVEYLARVWVSVDLPDARFRHPLWGRLHWMATPMAVIDLIAVLPFFMGIVLGIDLRDLRVLRVVRIFKLSRYSLALTVIADVARQEIRTLGAMIVVLLVIVVMSGSLVYLAEHTAQPHVFKDIPTTMWWAVVTLTTLGYGDMVPITTMGRVLGSVTAIFGIGMIALPSGVLASGFSEQLRLRREEYRNMVDEVLDEQLGQIPRSERRVLDDARRQLDLTEDEAIQILENEVKGVRVCPHCGLPHTSHHRETDED